MASLVALAWGGLRVAGVWSSPERLVAPLPALQDDVVPPPGLPPSTLAVPVRVDLAPLVEALEGAVPQRYGSLDERLDVPDNSRARVAFELSRGPFSASLQGSVARVGATVHYRGRGWYDPPVLPAVSASCGTGDDEELPRLLVALEAPISVTPDWRLKTRAGVAKVEPASEDDRDRCRITVIRIDVTGRVLNAARSLLTSKLPELDAAVAGVDIRSRFESWWSLLAEPIELTESVWLVLAPEAVRRGPIRGEGAVAEISVGLTARPRIVLGERPQLEPRPLPVLDTGVVEPGLDILVEGRAEYQTASAVLTRELAGSILTGGDRRLVIQGLEVSGIGGGRLALAVDVDGDVEARLYLVGTPRLDPATGQVTVPDLEFDVATSDLVVGGASWLARAGLAGYLRERARWPAAPAVDWATDKLLEGLNRSLSDDVALEGEVGGVRILGVHATRDALLVRAAARAQARLVVHEGTPGTETRPQGDS